MNFSDLISYSGQAHYSPNSQFIAILKGNVLSIFTTSHLNTYMTFNLPDTANILEWSPDSKCILAGISKRGQIKLFSVENPQWQGTISMNPSGLSGAFWAPNSTSILTSTEFCLRMTIWSLIDMTAVHIKGPKYPDKGYAFSSEGKFLALVERSESIDYIGIYFVADWTLVNHFKVETFDLCDILWTQDDTAIIVWDTSLVYQLLIYSPTGTLMARHQPYTNGLGIKSVSLSPGGDFLGVGSYDSEMRVFCNLSWRFLTNFPHKTSISEGADIHIYKEEEYKEGIGAGGLDERTTSRCKIYSDGLLDLPIKLNANKIPTDKPNPPMGVSICAWSADNRYIATKNGES